MKKILIVSALSGELNPIKKEIKKTKFNGLNISFLSVWIWNYNMILNLSRYLENNEVDFVINIWVCWYTNEKKDFIQVWRVKNISNNKELIVPNIIDFWELESIVSSEKVVYDIEELWWEVYVDMESYWFEKVCESFSLARIILKIPVDKVWDETKNFDFKKAEKYLEKNIDYLKLIKKIQKYLEKNNLEKVDLTKYNNYFSFSFTQKIIFKKLYNKYEVLTWEKFEEYFYKYIRNLEEIKNTKQESKKFLENLENYLENK